MSGGGTGAGGSGGGRSGQAAAAPLDDAAKQAIRAAWDQFMKPYLRG
jgi:hypothetical protein